VSAAFGAAAARNGANGGISSAAHSTLTTDGPSTSSADRMAAGSSPIWSTSTDGSDGNIAHWCTIGVSVILDGSLMHHHRCVGDLGWVADAPEVPSSHRPLSLDAWMSTRSSAGLGGSRGVVTSTGLSAVERRTVSELAVTPRHRDAGASQLGSAARRLLCSMPDLCCQRNRPTG